MSAVTRFRQVLYVEFAALGESRGRAEDGLYAVIRNGLAEIARLDTCAGSAGRSTDARLYSEQASIEFARVSGVLLAIDSYRNNGDLQNRGNQAQDVKLN